MSRSRLTTVAGLAHEQGEEVELLARELQGLAVERHGARRRVELDRADLLRAGRRGGRGGARAAQDGADAGDELAGAERLDDVVVGAELEAQHAVGLVAAGGEHDHRHALVGAQLAQQVEARAVGEHDVEEHEVGALAPGDLEAGRERAGRLRAEALASEGFRQRNGDRLLVLDEQHHPRLGVHALIVGGLGRCARRFSRLRRGRGHVPPPPWPPPSSQPPRPLLSPPPWPLLSSEPRPLLSSPLGRSRPGAAFAAAAVAAAMAMAGAVLATGRLAAGLVAVVVVVPAQRASLACSASSHGPETSSVVRAGATVGACSSSSPPGPASCRRWPASRPRPQRGSRPRRRRGTGRASASGGSAPSSCAAAVAPPPWSSPASWFVERRAAALDLGGVPGAGDALGADVDAAPGAQRREGHALELGARGHLDLERPALGVADREGARRAIDRGDATLDVARGGGARRGGASSAMARWRRRRWRRCRRRRGLRWRRRWSELGPHGASSWGVRS